MIQIKSMKNIFRLIILLTSIASISQGVYTIKGGGNVIKNGQPITPLEVRAQFENNQKILNLYNAGRNKKTYGNVCLYGGVAVLIGKIIVDLKPAAIEIQRVGTDFYGNPIFAPQTNENSVYPYFIGASLVLVAIPIKVGFSNKIRKAVALMNQEIANPKTAQIESTSFIANAHGVGVQIIF